MHQAEKLVFQAENIYSDVIENAKKDDERESSQTLKEIKEEKIDEEMVPNILKSEDSKLVSII